MSCAMAVALFVLWALDLVSSYAMGGFIHFLLVLSIVMVLVRPHPETKKTITDLITGGFR